MRALEFGLAVLVALIVFAVLKVIGVLIHVALIGAVVGFVVSLGIAFFFRRGS